MFKQEFCATGDAEGVFSGEGLVGTGPASASAVGSVRVGLVEEDVDEYIVTLNTDTLSTAAQRGFDPKPHVRSPRLTDGEEGGLFGFRFKAAGKA
ncbi:hypothetical protein ACFW9D_22635 [Streptomyces sp. NPDC059524]|uniref:hypothetical protein n=1 Tax=Streptomyces sp. NPDC059524 TaxID=3346856 RepID=UPI0036C13C99